MTRLTDAASGRELAKLDRLSAAGAGSGILGVAIDQFGDDLEIRVVKVYVSQVDDWLRKR